MMDGGMKIVAPSDIYKKFKKTIRKYKLIEKDDKILLAVSGGKDSITMLYLFSFLKKEFKFDFEVVHINLGIDNFSKISEEIVKEHCQNLDIKYNIVYLKEYGFTIKDIAKNIHLFKGRSICGICSTIKRYLIHKFARDNGFNKVATAHTLEDFVRFILDFYIDGDIKVLTRTYPKTRSEITNIEFIKPLFLISEKETESFVKRNELKVVSIECPFSKKKISTNLRIAEEIEKLKPRSKEKIVLNFIKYIYPELSKKYLKELNIKPCKICGMPTLREICSFCRIRAIFDSEFRKKFFERTKNT